jgi:hypothetical protein
VSILLVAPPMELGRILIERLVAQDDAVRIIEPRAERAPEWRALGAHVAAGELDADLVERAAQNVRTVVVFETDQLPVVVEGAENAGVTRIVVCTYRARDPILGRLNESKLDFIVLATGRSRRRHLGLVAEAIDAADDLPGSPRLILEVRSADARSLLRLTAETGKRDR